MRQYKDYGIKHCEAQSRWFKIKARTGRNPSSIIQVVKAARQEYPPNVRTFNLYSQ